MFALQVNIVILIVIMFGENVRWVPIHLFLLFQFLTISNTNLNGITQKKRPKI